VIDAVPEEPWGMVREEGFELTEKSAPDVGFKTTKFPFM
jgi:hypothetical protein